jgi:YHS domain-containing protein
MRHFDPVCGKQIEAAEALTLLVEGRAFSFCCHACRERFAADPGRYADLDHQVPDEVLEETERLGTHWFG